MDLKLSSHTATDAEVSAIDSVLGQPDSAWHGAQRDASDHHVARGGHALRDRRHRLLPVLHALNDRVGWISRGAINEIARRIDVAPAEVYGVATFYGLFSTTERAERQLHVCIDLACQMAGARSGDSLPDGAHESPCLGLCERAPAALLIEAGEHQRQRVVAPATPAAVRAALAGDTGDEAAVAAGTPQCSPTPSPALVLLSRIGVVDPESLHSYRAAGGYQALRRAFDIGPVAVIREITDSGIVGRGGAAFPAGRKWDAVARQPARPHYLVCNADESEPGTFKDRVLMEGDPFALIESITIAAFATGCEQGYIYLRGEYPRARRMLENAITQATAHGLLGDDVMGTGVSFHLDVFLGAGAYICGEETAIFNSIEGFRGEPRNKPPFPVDVGLFGKPTLVNNVETMMNVLPIVLHGGPAFATRGTSASTGTKLFCLSGSVSRPGVYEVDFGATLRDLIDLAGGVVAGRSMRAVLLGGAAGTFATVDDLDVPLTFEATRAAGLSLGSGVVMVLDDTTDLVAYVRRIAAFFRDESCGQCVPCRVGTVRQEEMLDRMVAGADPRGERELMLDIGRVMRDASICGLGQTAHNAIESAVLKLGVLS
ncbi:MAG: NADH-ubiquinone oxidoreductase-F iron-sulfur binding region domain-containing protein [Actinomycetota bacterium]